MPKKPDLRVVEKLHGDDYEPLGNLHDRLLNVIDEYCVREEKKRGTCVTLAEIVGTLEYVKREFM